MTDKDQEADQPSQESSIVLGHQPNTERKTFQNYFLEFLMIFIAVSLGFLADNFREQLKNKEEIQENMQSLLADLQSDVHYFDIAIEGNSYSYKAVDTLLDLLHNDLSNTAQIYTHARAVTANINSYYTNDKTFELMKSSGLLKLIRPRNLLDSLGVYYVAFQSLTQQNEITLLKLDAVHKGNSVMFDTYTFSQMNVKYDRFNQGHTQVETPQGQPPLLTTDRKTINDVALNYYYLNATQQFGVRGAERQRALAIRLIEAIKKEYHLEED